MIDDIFLGADVITCPVILGVRLRPLSIWHVWALRAAESPLINGGKFDIEDVCKAVMLCGMTREDYARQIQSGEIAITLGDVAAEYLQLSPEDREIEVANLADYIDQMTQFPEYWQKEKSDPVKDRIRCPTEWHLVSSLLAMSICKDESAAWDYPIARAQCWQAIQGEQAGSKNYMDAKDRADMDQLNAEVSDV